MCCNNLECAYFWHTSHTKGFLNRSATLFLSHYGSSSEQYSPFAFYRYSLFKPFATPSLASDGPRPYTCYFEHFLSDHGLVSSSNGNTISLQMVLHLPLGQCLLGQFSVADYAQLRMIYAAKCLHRFFQSLCVHSSLRPWVHGPSWSAQQWLEYHGPKPSGVTATWKLLKTTMSIGLTDFMLNIIFWSDYHVLGELYRDINGGKPGMLGFIAVMISSNTSKQREHVKKWLIYWAGFPIF